MSCRFVVISDTHFIKPPANNDGTWWNRTTQRYSKEMGEALVELIGGLSPDFVIHCGDFTGLDSVENFDFGLRFMNRPGCPWYGVPGNHDTWFPDSRKRFKEIFDTGEDTWSYSREIGGLRFFFLDVVHWYDKNGECSPYLDREKYDSGRIKGMGPSEKDLLWLEKELEKNDLPAVIITHAPVFFKDNYPLKTLPYGKPAKGPVTPPSGFIDDIEKRERLLGLVKNHPSVKACFAGHWHINDAFVSDDVLYVMTGALREFPYEIRLVEYGGDTFGITTHGLDVPELRKISYVKEWDNRWVEGERDVRDIVFKVR